MYCPTHLMLADYFKKPLPEVLFHNFRGIIMGIVIPFTLLEKAFSYIRRDCVGKQIPSKYILLGTGELLKETKNMIEDENEKQVRTSTGGLLKKMGCSNTKE